MGLSVEGMKDQSALNAWSPALAQTMRELADAAGGSRTVLKILEVCAGCKSVSSAAAKEARENFGIQDVQVFSLDGKPGTNCTLCVDILTYDWTRDDELCSFREEMEEGARYIYYAHASPPCGPYSAMANRYRGSLSQRDLRWGDAALPGAYQLFRPRLLDGREQGSSRSGYPAFHASTGAAAKHSEFLPLWVEQVEGDFHLDQRAGLDA